MTTIKEIPVMRSYYGEDAPLARNERNDCCVRALTAATGLEYSVIHQYLKTVFGRKDRQGVAGFNFKMRRGSDVLGEKYTPFTREELQTSYINHGREVKRQMTVGTFVKQYPTGTYVLAVRGHAFCLVDGIVVGGNAEDGKRLKARITGAYKF